MENEFDDYEPLYCIMCDSELVILGVLGKKIWYKCRACGLEQNAEVEE